MPGDPSFFGISNASAVNCLVCWILYFFSMFIGFVLVVFALCFVVLLCQGELMPVIKWFIAATKSYLLNRPWPT